HYRVPRHFGGDAPLLRPPYDASERATIIARLFDVLFRVWGTELEGASERRVLQLIRLGVEAGRRDEVVVMACAVADQWLGAQSRHAETASLVEPLLELTGRNPALLLRAAVAKGFIGHGRESGELLKEAVSASAQLADGLRAAILFKYIEWLRFQGEWDAVIGIGREELLPLLSRMGAVRESAVTMGQIADVLAARGDVDEALRIRREEELPVYERLGDVRSMIVGRVNLALLLLNRGENHSEAVQHLTWSYQAAVRGRFQEAGQIAEIFQQLGLSAPEET
ncbi:MAG TPA: hypothetical protein VE913_16845, partial [Longimicrobium sp.]|nr:hypothetical protein [Longimicrobium sp.]